MIGNLSLVGLTGGIGSGKSTVAAMIRGRGVPVLDADQIAREIVEPHEPAFAEIAHAWPDVVETGRVDRRRLAGHVFSDPGARARLEAITHPRIQERALEKARALEQAGHRLAFYEASLLVETGRHRDFDGLVVVTASEENQISRVMARDRATRAEALARIRAQLPLADKRRLATFVIENDGDLAATEVAVVRMLAAQGA